jgi:hypothetical protein
MSGVIPDCRHARLHIGADPQQLPADVRSHVSGCEGCRHFLDESLGLDARVRQAMELPLGQFRATGIATARAPRRLALAASVVLALMIGGGFWFLQATPALAGEIADHVMHEAGSWDRQEPLPAAAVGEVLRQAGVQFDSSFPVVYASACPFRGRRIPHLVVHTPEGPLTVMLLAHETVAAPREFSEQGLSGILLPAGRGGVAVLARAGEVPGDLAGRIVSGVRW